MKKLVLFSYLAFLIQLGFSQQKISNFPENALGVYKGTLEINSTRGNQKIPMEFHLKKTDSIHKFDYILIYNGSPRNYTLVVKDLEKGLFEVDENNGIILPTKYFDKTLYSFFEVQGNFLSSRLQFKKGTLDFEILFTATKNKIKTGGSPKAGGKSKKIPKVFGYPISIVQKAILKKVN